MYDKVHRMMYCIVSSGVSFRLVYGMVCSMVNAML